VQGVLRLAAHKVLGERPHFGGKHSEHVIEDGIKTLEGNNILPRLDLNQDRRTWRQVGTILISVLRHPRRGQSQAAHEIVHKSTRAVGQRQGFGPKELKELRKAIKAKDQKRIDELTSKIGKPSFDD
jgi:hypothetical protein